MQHIDLDAYKPAEMALRVEQAGVAKAKAGLIPLFTLAVLAGAFIAFGAMVYTVAVTGSTLGVGPTKLLGGLAFCLGLVLVIVGGAELFTGNSLIVMAWADGKISVGALLRNWGVVYLGNFVGAGATAVLMHYSGALAPYAQTAIAIAEAKVALPMAEAVIRGLLCNVLVCLAVWLCFAARTVIDKVVAILFPITAFVAIGFEHSVANMYLIPIGMMAGDGLDIAGYLTNLIPVTVGNIIGGGVFVAGVYWLIYLRGRD
jgi:formate/nitrite transporter